MIKEKEPEIWKSHALLNKHYQISNHGRLRSVSRFIDNNGGKVLRKGRIINSFPNFKGYLSVHLNVEGKSYSWVIHRLVAHAFVANPLNLPQVNHDDLNKTNNYYKNLIWCTNRENSAHYNLSQKTTSKYVGVHWSKKAKKWCCQILIEGKKYTVGHFDDENIAGSEYKDALNKWNELGLKPELLTSSKYKNISYNKSRKKWQAYKMINSKKINIGFYETEEEAYKQKIIYDTAKEM